MASSFPMNTPHCITAALLGLVSTCTLAASGSGMRIVSADLTQVRGPMSGMGQLCVGAGRANEGLRADWQRQLAHVKEECGFGYLRFHGLLCDDMGVVVWDSNLKKHVYNWQYIDELFDYMLSIDVKPFVELGFMPTALASGPSTIFWWKGNVTPPKDYAEWEALISALLTHWTERYGEDEVASWYFEVWNEPNLSGFWIGDTGGRTEAEFQAYAKEEYFKLYASTAKAVKSVSGRYRVGGPATAGNAWVPELIEFCTKNAIPLDFASTHHYAVMHGYLDETGTHGTVLAPERNALVKEVKGVRAQIEASSRPGLELHYTEWSTSYTPSDPVHDSYHSPAFILNKVKSAEDAVQSMSYWTFTDIFEEAGPRATPFHGGFGMVNYQGIRKPSFFAYNFLNKLGAIELKNDDADSWVCTDGKGAVQVLAWDFIVTHPGPTVLNQQYYCQDLPSENSETPFVVSLSNLAPGAYTMKLHRVGYRSNDAYTAYIDLGSPAQLTREHVAFLKAKSTGEPEKVELVRVGTDGLFQRDIPMRQNDVILLTLEPQAAGR